MGGQGHFSRSESAALNRHTTLAAKLYTKGTKEKQSPPPISIFFFLVVTVLLIYSPSGWPSLSADSLQIRLSWLERPV